MLCRMVNPSANFASQRGPDLRAACVVPCGAYRCITRARRCQHDVAAIKANDLRKTQSRLDPEEQEQMSAEAAPARSIGAARLASISGRDWKRTSCSSVSLPGELENALNLPACRRFSKTAASIIFLNHPTGKAGRNTDAERQRSSRSCCSLPHAK